MPDDAPEPSFLRYLTCDLPQDYPFNVPISRLLTPTAAPSLRRDLLRQQARFLDQAGALLPTHPWITYLAAARHEAVLIAIPTRAEQLVEITDMSLFNDLQQKARELRAASKAALDEVTAQNCDRLLLLQDEAAPIQDAIKSFSGALKAGFTALDPLPPSVPEPVPERNSLRYFIGGGVACAAVGLLLPPSWFVLFGVVTGVAIMAGAGTVVVRKENEKERARLEPLTVQFRANIIHEQFHNLCRKSIGLVLALPFEIRQSALVDLPSCLTALQTLPPERQGIEDAYITPFVSQ